MATPESIPDKPASDEAGAPKDVEVRPDDIEVAPHIERATGIKSTPSQFTAQVQDDQGQPIMHSPSNKQVTITLPTTQTNLQHWSGGKITESVTWFALYWLRMLKKAAGNGWKVFTSTSQTNNQNDD